MVKRVDGREYNKADYRANSQDYIDCFQDYLDCVSWLINGIYWEAKYPRVLSREALKTAVEKGTSRLLGLTDISADYEGSIEFTSRFTSIEEPFLLYDPINLNFKEKISDFEENEILFHSVDHLPAEMPKEASNHFGSKLFPFVKQVVEADFNTPWGSVKDLPEEIYNAVIAADGRLTPQYAYIADLRALNERTDAHESGSSVNAQAFCVSLTGHLFDKKSFNRILDKCEQNGVVGRVVGWEVGFTRDDPSTVTIQCISEHEPALDELRAAIEKQCKEDNIQVKQAKGPQLDKKILKKIHQDHSH